MNTPRGTWNVATESTISLRTSRIGLLSIHAHAPVVSGWVRIADGDVALEFVVAINRVSTGNPLLDPEVHALVNSGSDGMLTFTGAGATLAAVSGHASAGNVVVPLELGAQLGDEDDGLPLELTGTTAFRDLRLPLPGLGHIHHVDVDIEGLVTLLRATANS